MKTKKSEFDLVQDIEKTHSLFIDQNKNTYVVSKKPMSSIAEKVDSKKFQDYLADLYYKKTGQIPSDTSLQGTIRVLQAKARNNEIIHDVHVRCAPLPNKIGIAVDLGRGDGTAMIIRPDYMGEGDSGVYFTRPTGSKPLPIISGHGSDITKIFKYMNLPPGDEWKILIHTWLVAACIPWIQTPILVLNGPPGSAKSSGAYLLKSIIDPDSTMLTRMPNNDRDLAIAALNCMCLCFDNLRKLPPATSDFLCCVVTGGSFKTRKLYTDSDEVIISIMKRVILTGIQNVIEEPDLVDRCIIFNLPRISSEKVHSHSDFLANLSADLPSILGGLYELIMEVLNLLPEISIEKSTRFVDFSRVGVAVEKSMGYAPGFFMRSYEKIRNGAFVNIVESDPVAAALHDLLGDREEQLLTANELGKALKEKTKIEGIASQSWPNNARALSVKLRSIEEILYRSGIQIEFNINRGNKKRLIWIKKIDISISECEEVILAEDNFQPAFSINSVDTNKFSLKEYQISNDITGA